MEYQGWRNVHVGFEGDELEIGGVRIWATDWCRTGQEAIELPHPSYPHQRRRFDIYVAGDVQNPIRFAAAELSNGVWGFYAPI